MTVLVVGGAKTKNIVEAVKQCFSAGSVDFEIEQSITEMERFFDSGRYFDRALIVDQGLCYELESGDLGGIRERLAKFVDTLQRRSKNNPKVIFVCGSEEVAEAAYQETMAISNNTKVLLKAPPYTVSFMVEAVSSGLKDLEHYAYTTLMQQKETVAASDGEDDQEDIEDGAFEVDSFEDLMGVPDDATEQTDDLGVAEGEDSGGFEDGGFAGEEFGAGGPDELDDGASIGESLDFPGDGVPEGESEYEDGPGDLELGADDMPGGFFGGLEVTGEPDMGEPVDIPEDMPSNPDGEQYDAFGMPIEEVAEPEENLGLEGSDAVVSPEGFTSDVYGGGDSDTDIPAPHELPAPGGMGAEADVGVAPAQPKHKPGRLGRRRNVGAERRAPSETRPEGKGFGMSEKDFNDLKTILKTFELRGHVISILGLPCTGKTTLVANLADVAEKLGCSVLMVDFDVNGRGLAYHSRKAFDSVHSLDVERSSLREAVNNSAAVPSLASILSPGKHLLTTGLAGDFLLDGWTDADKLSRMCSNVKGQYQIILMDIPWDFGVGVGSRLLYNSDEIVITSGLSTHDLAGLMLKLCNISDEGLANILWTQSKLMFTKVRGGCNIFGKRATGIGQVLGEADAMVFELLGDEPEYLFQDMCVCGQIPYDSTYDSYVMAGQAYTDDRQHEALYLDVLRRILLGSK